MGCWMPAGSWGSRRSPTSRWHRESSPGKYRPGDRPKGIRRFGRYFRGDGLEKAQPVVDLLGEIGERYSRSPAQVALRWLMEKERVLPIPGAKTGRQAASNAGALSFTLADAEIKALDRATTPWRR